MMSLISSKIRMKRLRKYVDNNEAKRLQNYVDKNEADDNITKDHHVRRQSKKCTTSDDENEAVTNKTKNHITCQIKKYKSRWDQVENGLVFNVRGNIKYHVYDTDVSYQIHFDLPGVKHTDIGVDIMYENIVRVYMIQYLYIRKNFGVNVSNMRAAIQDGVLILDIPKEVPPSKQIEINVTEMNDFDNFFQKDENIFMKLDLPGIKTSDIKIQIHEENMYIHGKRSVTTSNRFIHIRKTLSIDTKLIIKMKSFLVNGVLIMTIPNADHDEGQEKNSTKMSSIIYPIHVQVAPYNNVITSNVNGNNENYKVSQETTKYKLNHKIKYGEGKITSNTTQIE